MKKEIKVSAIETVDTVSAEKIIATSGKKNYRVLTSEDKEAGKDVGDDVVGIYPTASSKRFRADMLTQVKKFETAYKHFVRGWNQAVEDGVIISDFNENVSAKMLTLKEWKAQKPDWKLEEDVMWLKAGEEADEVTFGYTDLGDYYYIFVNVNLKESEKVESTNTPIEEEVDASEYAVSEITAVTAVNSNYASGVYRWYYKSCKTKAQAFKYLWNKRGSYKGTTEFIFRIEIDGETVFNFDSAAKDYALKISDEEIQKLYEEAEGEKVCYRTNRGNVKEVKICETFGTTPQKYWNIYHEICGFPEEAVITLAIGDEVYGSEFATQLCKFVANDTDGSNDEPEEENEFGYNFDVEDDDDDELADEYIMVNVGIKSDITEAAMAQVEKVQEVSTAELEYLLKGYEAELATHKAAVKESVRNIKYYQNAIIEYMSSVMKAEDFIADLGVEIMEAKAQIEWLEEETAKINAKLLSRQFNGSALIESVKAAEKVQSVAGVNFDLQQFNDAEINIAGSAATIDTAVSKTEIPYIDEDAEFDAETKKLAEEFEEVDAKLADIETQIEELQYKISKLEDLKLTTYDSRIALEVKWREHTYKLDELLDKKIKRGNYEMTLNGVYTVKGNEQDFSTRIKGDRQIALYLWRTNTKLATFESVKEFKAAVDKLGAAIEHGDKEFTFPADK